MNMYLEKYIDSDVVSIVKSHLNEDRDSNKNLISNSWIENKYNYAKQLISRSRIKCEYRTNKIVRQIEDHYDAASRFIGRNEINYYYQHGRLIRQTESSYDANYQPTGYSSSADFGNGKDFISIAHQGYSLSVDMISAFDTEAEFNFTSALKAGNDHCVQRNILAILNAY
ncbi:hypothetical protein REG_1653 [Candidatus Regiella insecticola LSR1]|uniref:Uncharacterized protein n=1 Tax=Candidatus Regiella insecticola LSR1 TaxID=663321 RepID=E0WU83_9ENTR|nr:hypothetical protein [Candidatus Regiella insecticola]EFL91438.1 hypothetical protein REG_1653 [Candidatus Regiella insecticola LSR1]